MYISKVISFKNAWNDMVNKNPEELQEILDASTDFLSNFVITESEGRNHPRAAFEKAFCDKDWKVVNQTYYSPNGQRVHLGNMGLTKNGVGVLMPFGFMDHLSRWIFQQSALAVKLGIMKLPILLVPISEFSRRVGGGNGSFFRSSFEMYRGQLDLLSPLSHQLPFLIIGISDQPIIGNPEIIEIEADLYAENTNQIIDRFIEFPPEYHQAGLGILSYFGSYLREQYPNEEATVKIEQHGLSVRMIIETASGRSEIVEKALHEYDLIVLGKEPPEKFATSDTLVLELKQELRIAQVRIESKQDMIDMQKTRISELTSLVSQALNKTQPIAIDFSPTISVINTVQINPNISLTLNDLNELLGLIPSSSETYFALSQLKDSLESIEKDNDSESVKKSPAMSKFKKLIDKIVEGGNEISETIKNVESGWDKFKDLAKKYNSVAEWCGLPLIPPAIL